MTDKNDIKKMLISGFIITMLVVAGMVFIIEMIVERRLLMAENEEMEKRGVVCDCASHPNESPKDLTKTASGDYACPYCGKPGTPKEEDTEVVE